MQIVKLRKVDDTVMILLSAAVLETLHLRENDETAVEVVDDRIVLTRASADSQAAWASYEQLEPLSQRQS